LACLSFLICFNQTVPQKEQARKEVQEGEEVQMEEAQGREIQEGPQEEEGGVLEEEGGRQEEEDEERDEKDEEKEGLDHIDRIGQNRGNKLSGNDYEMILTTILIVQLLLNFHQTTRGGQNGTLKSY
jgi:hypothetical protein